IPACHAASSVASACISEITSTMLPSAAPPKPSCGNCSCDRPSRRSANGSMALPVDGLCRFEPLGRRHKLREQRIDLALRYRIDADRRAAHCRRTNDAQTDQQLLVQMVEEIAA